MFQVATASQFFISYTIRTFGALTFATIMTTRQVDIDMLSVIILAYITFNLFFSYDCCPCPYVIVAGEYIAFLHLVCTSSELDAVGWRSKSSSTSVSAVTSQYHLLLFHP